MYAWVLPASEVYKKKKKSERLTKNGDQIEMQ